MNEKGDLFDFLDGNLIAPRSFQLRMNGWKQRSQVSGEDERIVLGPEKLFEGQDIDTIVIDLTIDPVPFKVSENED